MKGVPSDFWLLWLSQTCSLLATDVSKHALRVWLFEQSGKISDMAALVLLSDVPSILVCPIAGTFVDRSSKRTVMLVSDAIAAFASVVVNVCFSIGVQPSLALFLCVNSIQSVSSSFQFPAYAALLGSLVPPEKVDKAAGLSEAAPALSLLLAPLLSGFLLSRFGIRVIFILELLTFFVATFFTLMITKEPSVPSKAKLAAKFSNSFFSECLEGFNFILTSKPLLELFIFVFLGQFISGCVQVLMTPLILSFASSMVLGMILTVSGTGALFGSGVMALVGSPKSRVNGIVWGGAFQGILLVICAVWKNSNAILAISFLYMAAIPYVRACRQGLISLSVPSRIQGRIFAMQKLVLELSFPIASIVMVPFADFIAAPLIESQVFLSDLFGSGSGGVSSLLFFGLGLLFLIWSCISSFSTKLYSLDSLIKKSKDF